MADHDLQRVEELFNAAADLPQPDRTTYLHEQCGGDDGLREHVEALLDQLDHDGLTLPDLPREALGDGTNGSALTEGPGSIIGRYKLLQVIGEGGFGVVYMAEQLQPVRRKVALKIIKLGMDTREVVARFEAERQALAMMDHPNIARVLDGGATNSGRPYFVMELVRGVSITEYCDREELSTRERLELFEHVCHALQHAHQKGVIHRDLKPSNVLVTLHDGEAMPKIIDFGVAKAMHARLTDKTLFTRYEQFIGTPAYMSPEQAEMSALDVDTRTDIYSLGVLLYELLTGTTPFDNVSIEKVGLAGIQRFIMEHEPMRPSVRISSTGDAAAARHRQLDVGGLSKRLRGDLDWIVMKALEKERNRRYATAGDFAEDVRRHLRNEPVLAGPPGAVYRTRKFLARNRAAAISATLVLLVLVGGIIGTSLALYEAERERARVDRQARHTLEAMEFLVSTLALADRDVALDPDVTVRDLLDHTADRVADAFTEQRWAEARVRNTIGHAYFSLSEFTLAEPHLRRTVQLVDELREESEPVPGYDLGDFYDTLWTLTNVCYNLERTDAFAVAMRARAAGLEHVGASYPEVAALLGQFTGAVEQGAWSVEPGAMDGVLDQFERAARRADALVEHGDPRWLIIADTFLVGAYTLWYSPHEPLSEPFLRKTLEIQRRELPPEHPDITITVGMLVGNLNNQGRGTEAETLMRDAVDVLRRSHGDNAFRVAAAESLLGECMAKQGRHAEAEPIMLRSHETMVEAVSETNWMALQSALRLISLYESWGREEAGAAFRDSVARTAVSIEYWSAWRVAGPTFGPAYEEIAAIGAAIDEACGGISFQASPGARTADPAMADQVRELQRLVRALDRDDPRAAIVGRLLLGWANALAPDSERAMRRAMAEVSLETLDRTAPQLHLDRAEALAIIALGTDDVTQARKLAEKAWRLQRDVPGGGMWFTEAARVRIGRSLIASGLRQEAEV
ncbi:MAG: serine/threonine-protein kinase, partial [Planctomycetota bacterium]